GTTRSGVDSLSNPEAIRGWPWEWRSLDLEVAARVQHRAGGLVGARAQPHDPGRLRAAQVEVAVLEPRLFPDLDVLVDREGQRRGLVEHLEPLGDDLDLARGQVGVLVALGAAAYLARDLDDELAAQRGRDRRVA